MITIMEKNHVPAWAAAEELEKSEPLSAIWEMSEDVEKNQKESIFKGSRCVNILCKMSTF